MKSPIDQRNWINYLPSGDGQLWIALRVGVLFQLFGASGINNTNGTSMEEVDFHITSDITWKVLN